MINEILKEAEALRKQRKKDSEDLERQAELSVELKATGKKISTNPFVFIKTSGQNLYCGFFAIANRIKFCDYQTRRDGYRRIGLNADKLNELFLKVIHGSPMVESDNILGEKKPEENLEIYRSLSSVKDFLVDSDFRKSLYSLDAFDHKLMRNISQMIYGDRFDETKFQLGLANSKLNILARKTYIDQCLNKLGIVICTYKFSKDKAFDLKSILEKYLKDQNFRTRLNSEFIDYNFVRYTGLAYNFTEFGDILRDYKSSSSFDSAQFDKPSLFDIFDLSQYKLSDFSVEIPNLKLTEKQTKLLTPNYYQKMLGLYLQEKYLKEWREEFKRIFMEKLGLSPEILLVDGYLDDHTIPHDTQHLIIKKFNPNLSSMSNIAINYQLHTDLDFDQTLSDKQRAMQFAIINPNNSHYTTLLTFEQYLNYCISSSIPISTSTEEISEEEKSERIKKFTRKFPANSHELSTLFSSIDIDSSKSKEKLSSIQDIEIELRNQLKKLITKSSRDSEMIKAISDPQIALKEFVTIESRVANKILSLEYGRTINGTESLVINLNQLYPDKYVDDVYQINFTSDSILISKREQVYGGSGLEFCYQEISDHQQKSNLIRDSLIYLEQHNSKTAEPKIELAEQVLNLARFLTLKEDDELIHSITQKCQFRFGFSLGKLHLFAIDKEDRIEIGLDNLLSGNLDKIKFTNQSPNSKKIWQERIGQFNALIYQNKEFISNPRASTLSGISPSLARH